MADGCSNTGDVGGKPGGGAMADVVGDRFGPLLELRKGVGNITPQEAALSPHGNANLLPTGTALCGDAPTKIFRDGASAPPTPQVTPPALVGVPPGAGAVVAPQST